VLALVGGLDCQRPLADPVQALFGVQLGGGTDINRAIAYCEERIEEPTKTHLALTDTGRPGHDPRNAEAFAALGVPVFACTPDQFPALMAAALRREDIALWAAGQDIKLVRQG
jgi:hypothetical protein